MSTLTHVFSQIRRDRMATLLERAVRCYSPSYQEGEVCNLFAQALQSAAIPFRFQPVPIAEADEVDDPRRGNLIVELGPPDPAVLWIGHLDTVPLTHGDVFAPRWQGDTLHGLGTADMKSGCVAVIEALCAIREAGLSFARGVQVAFVVGEEEYGDGSRALEPSIAAPLLIIGEPTELKPCIAHYGYLELRLSARGERAHAALPEVGQNAIQAMLQWLLQINESLSRAPFAGVALNMREIRGGTELFMVAETCESVIDIHTPPEEDDRALLAHIESLRQQLEIESSTTLTMEVLHHSQGYRQDRDDPLLAPVERAYAEVSAVYAPSAFRSHSDGNLLYRRGLRPVICGPGRLEVAHRQDERVSLLEMEEAARLYAAIFLSACAIPTRPPTTAEK